MSRWDLRGWRRRLGNLRMPPTLEGKIGTALSVLVAIEILRFLREAIGDVLALLHWAATLPSAVITMIVGLVH